MLDLIAGYPSTNITTNTTTTVFTGSGTLIRIVVNTTAAGTIIIKDGTVVKGTLKASITEGSYTYGISVGTSLVIVTAGSPDITVVWSQS